MKKHYFFLTAMLIGATAFAGGVAAADRDSLAKPGTTIPSADLKINNMHASVSLLGSLDKCGFLSRKTSTICANGLWVGGMKEDTLHLAAQKFGSNGIDFTFGPLASGSLTQDTSGTDWAHVWKTSRQAIDDHLAQVGQEGYEAEHDISTWPGPYVDVDGNGAYDPYSGDYPLISGDQMVFGIFNDMATHSESHGEPLGIEVHMTAYAFDELSTGDSANPLNNTVFVSYKIFNRSDNTYTDCYLGSFTDFDIGYGQDDYTGCDVARNTYYCYNGDEVDGPGSGSFDGVPPAQGCVVLTGASEGGESLGMSSFLSFRNQTSGINGDPAAPDGYYNFMQGRWMDGSYIKYGDDGCSYFDEDSLYCLYMFPGNTDPQHKGTFGVVPQHNPDNWTQYAQSSMHLPLDCRGLGASGPFTFEPGQWQQLDLAYVAAKADTGTTWTSVELMQQGVDGVKRQWESGTTDSGRPFAYMPRGGASVDNVAAQSVLRLYPNPVTNRLNINLSVAESCTAELYDMMGHCVGSCQVRDGHAVMDLAQLPAGIYLLRCQGATSRIIKH